jgi:hypothetical protein
MFEQSWKQETIIDFIKLALGAFLILTPWIFGFTSVAVASGNAWISGAVIGLVSIAAIVALADWEEWVSLAFGLWVMISPWALGFHATVMSAMRSDVAIGAAVALFAVAELLMMHRNPPQVTA